MRRIRFSTLLIILLPLGAVAIGASFLLANLTRVAAVRLPQLIDSLAADRLNGKLKIGKIDTYANCIRLRNVSLYDAKGQRAIAEVPEVRVYCKISDLILRRTNVLDGIQCIDVMSPSIYVERDSKGRWNWADILKPTPKKPIDKWHLKINVSSAHLTVRDLGAKKFGPTENVLRDVNASIDTSRMPMVKAEISGLGSFDRLGRFAVNGWYDLVSHALYADLQLSDADAAYWSHYPLTIGVNILSGKIQVRGRVSKASKSAPVQYTASAKIQDASLKFRPIRAAVREINGTADVVNELISLNLHGMVGNSPVVADGYVLNPIHPRLLLRVASQKANFREIVGYTSFSSILKKLRLPTTGVASARIFGRPKSIAASFKLQGPSASYAGFDYSDVRAEGVYFNRRVTLRHASVRTCGGVLNGSGDVEFGKKPKVVVDGDALGLKLQDFPMVHGNSLAAASDGKFKIAYGTGGVDILYKGDLKDGRLTSLNFGRGDLAAEYSGGVFRIASLRIGAYGGNLAATGLIAKGGAIQLRLAGADVNLAALGNGRWKIPAVGHGEFSGEINGKLDDPVFSGKVDGYRVAAGGMEFDRISGEVTASRDLVELSNVVAYSYPGTITFNGSVRNPLASPWLDLSIVADKLDVDAMAELFGRAPSTGGTAYGDLYITGPVLNPGAEGRLRVENAWYHGIPMDSLNVSFSYHDRTIKLPDLSLRSGSSVLTASGEIPPSGKIAVRFNAEEVPLSKFSCFVRPYAALSGKVDIAGIIEGTKGDPHAEVALDCRQPSINNQVFESLKAGLTVDRSGAIVHDMSLADAGSAFSISKLRYDVSTKLISVDASLKNEDGEKLLRIVNASPFVRKSADAGSKIRRFVENLPSPFSGRIDADITGSVRLSKKNPDPNITAKASVADLVCGKSSLKSVQVQGSWQHGIIHVQKMEALDKDLNISADGSFGPTGAMAFQLDAHGVPMEAVRHWVQLPDNFSGRADVTLVVSGRSDSPNSEMSFEVADPVIEGVKFDVLRGRVSTVGGKSSSGDENALGELRVDDLMLILGSHAFRASGYVPVDWRKYKIPEDRPMLFESHLDGSSLELLSAFTGLKAETAPDGKFSGDVKLAGSINAPSLDGELIWQGGKISIPRIENPLQDIDARVILKGDELTIDRLTGSSGGGGTFNAVGKISLAGMKPSVDIGVTTDNLAISGHNVSNSFGEEVRARITSKLKVNGSCCSPIISGNVDVPSASISVAGKTTKSDYVRNVPVNVGFDVKASLGRDVQLRSGRLRTPLFGDINIHGTMAKPSVEANLDISGGSISFPMRQLRIDPGSSVYMHVAPSLPTTMLVDMRAEGRVPSTSLLGKTKTYTVTMTARGPLSNLDLSFTASPPDLSPQDIISLLAGQQQLQQAFSQNGNTDIARVLQTTVVPTIFETVGDTVQDIFGIGEFGLETGYNEPVRLTIGNQIANNLYLDYTSVLGARPDYSDDLYEVKLSYRFSRSLQIDLGTGDKQGLISGVSSVLRF
jgi:translocation and assembly module TamB